MLSKQLVDDVSRMLIRQLLLYIAANKARQAQQAGLILKDYEALEYIVEFEVLPTGHLAQLLNLSPSGTNALVNRLEEAAYIKRGRYPFDRRIVAITPIRDRCERIIATPQEELLTVLQAIAQKNPRQILGIHNFLMNAMPQLKTGILKWIEQG